MNMIGYTIEIYFDFRPREAATKLINCLNANNGSIWMMRPNQMQVFNVADYVLPKPQNAKPCSFPKVYGML